ncbi:hypothetical protein G3I77_29880 [Streptomyces sp. D2-8]|uniref:hypothetical protein n=1 Tax=Streptomyces sp. D2-8 TaxID=2707767 RepID=UPI0020C0E0D1|nr:hypothetical protein [Streptomyces sp. D2-8]MCK8437059.1 hypothetical protein [Streptomyces sp. D2-8]
MDDFAVSSHRKAAAAWESGLFEVHAMRERGAGYALRTMCEAGGLANAMVLERV